MFPVNRGIRSNTYVGSKLHAAQEALKESEQRFADLVEYSPDAIMIMEGDSGRFLIFESNPDAYWLDDYAEMIADYPVELPYRSYGPQ